MTRTKPKSERRNDLLDAAERLLLGKHIDAITVDEVVGGAGVSKGTFYLYFQSKDDVLAALRDRYMTDLLAKQAAAIAHLPEDDWAGRVETWLVAGVREFLAEPGNHDVLYRHNQPSEPGTESLFTHLEFLEEMLDSGQQAGTFDLPDPHATAVLLAGALYSTTHYLFHLDDSAATENLVAELRRVIRLSTRTG